MLKFKKMLTALTCAVMAANMLAIMPFSVFADDMPGKYQFTMFASSNVDGAININSNNFCVNGKIATNGTVICNENANVNVSKVEKVCAEMVYIPNKIKEDFFDGYNKEEVNEDYSLVETNIHIEKPLSVNGVTELSGNITIDSGLKSKDDIYISGNVQNSSKTVIYSQYGNINFDSDNVNLNGLIYAPFGNINIKANNLTLNDTMIIANTITIEAPSVNVNYSERFGKYLGETSDTMEISEEDYKYFTDDNGNNIPDFFENSINWKYIKDTDGDGVPDIIEINTGSNPNVSEENYNNVLDSYTLEMMYNNPMLLYNYETNSLYIYGDISDNKILDVYDLFLMKRGVKNHEYNKIGDVDGDGDMDEEDVEYLSDYLIGKSKTLPAYYLNGVFTNKMRKLQEAAKVYLTNSNNHNNDKGNYGGKKDIWLVFMYLRSLGKDNGYTTNCQEVEENPQKNVGNAPAVQLMMNLLI